jgi:hypothetical protein
MLRSSSLRRYHRALGVAGFLAGTAAASWGFFRICESVLVDSYSPVRFHFVTAPLPETTLMIVAFVFGLKLISVALLSARD